MANEIGLEGRAVLVTGGANGIGAATVRTLVERGARAYFCDIDAPQGDALCEELGNGATFARVDLMDPQAIGTWVAGIGEQEGEIHGLVNNAALDPRLALEDTRVEDWDDLFARNMRAYFLCCREASPWLVDGSAIVNLSSVTFHEAPAKMTAYVATKGAIQGFTRSLARELGPRGIRVNTVSPGWVMTERQLAMYADEATQARVMREQCVPKLLLPEELADVIVFLLGKESRAISGQELLVDRGWRHS